VSDHITVSDRILNAMAVADGYHPPSEPEAISGIPDSLGKNLAKGRYPNMNAKLNAKLLAQKLQAEAARGFLIGALGDDEFCLMPANGGWQVVYAERGAVQDILFESPHESEACEFLYQKIMSFRHNHLVGFFATPDEAAAMGQALTHMGLQNHSDRIPYRQNEPRFRVFVYGKDIFTAKQRWRELPIAHWPL
jgi:hypothetical protein